MKLINESFVRESLEAFGILWDSGESILIHADVLPVDTLWLEGIIKEIPDRFKKNHFAILTSGSTGTPKIVIGDKRSTEFLVDEIHRSQELEGVDVTVCALPLSYSYSFVNQWLWAHRYKKKIVFTEGLSNPQSLMKVLKESLSSMICLVGSQLGILEKYVVNEKFDNVKVVNFAGGRYPQEKINWLSELFPNAKFFHNYGCTEALPRLTIREGSEFDDPMVLGKTLPGIELSISEEGELLFRSKYSAKALVDKSEIKIIQESDWIKTGDLAEFSSSMGGFRLKGRSNDVFKRYGEKISLAIISETLRKNYQFPFAFYIEEGVNGELGHVLVLERNKEAFRDVLIVFRNNFKRTHWPVRVETCEILPLSSNGKYDSSKLKMIQKEILWKQLI